MEVNHYQQILRLFERASAHYEGTSSQCMEECVNKYIEDYFKNTTWKIADEKEIKA